MAQFTSVSQMMLDGKPEYNKIMNQMATSKNGDENTKREPDHRSKSKPIEPKTYKWEVDWVYSIALTALHIYAVYAAHLTICGRVQIKTLLYCEYNDVNMHILYTPDPKVQFYFILSLARNVLVVRHIYDYYKILREANIAIIASV